LRKKSKKSNDHYHEMMSTTQTSAREQELSRLKLRIAELEIQAFELRAKEQVRLLGTKKRQLEFSDWSNGQPGQEVGEEDDEDTEGTECDEDEDDGEESDNEGTAAAADATGKSLREVDPSRRPEQCHFGLACKFRDTCSRYHGDEASFCTCSSKTCSLAHWGRRKQNLQRVDPNPVVSKTEKLDAVILLALQDKSGGKNGILAKSLKKKLGERTLAMVKGSLARVGEIVRTDDLGRPRWGLAGRAYLPNAKKNRRGMVAKKTKKEK